MIIPGTRVYRYNRKKGFAVPAFIHNGNYFFVDIYVYEDGRVEHWGMRDFDFFVEKVNEGWIRLAVPDGDEISIHGLGRVLISSGKWTFNETSFVEYMKNLVKVLNPDMTNLYHYEPIEIDGVIHGEWGKGAVYREVAEDSQAHSVKEVFGETLNLFYKTGLNSFQLVRLNIYKDYMVEIACIENPVLIGLEEFKQMALSGEICTMLPENAVLQIYGLGEVIVHNTQSRISANDKVLEIEDILRRLNGEKDSITNCRNILLKYRDNPTTTVKNELRIAYEKIPAHNRKFVGDMDVKDTEVRMIIYGADEIKKWSHYQAAKESGLKLPVINIPETKDDKSDVS